jgi:hypothetical protein
MKSGPDAPSVSKKIEQSTNKLPVLVSHLRFAAYDVDKKQVVTNVATDAERLTGSFQVNIKPYNTNNSIYVVVIPPNGRVLPASGSQKKTFRKRNVAGQPANIRITKRCRRIEE